MTLTLSLFAALLAAEAQPAGKMPCIGVIIPGSPPGASSDELDVFRQGLRDLGYVEGQTIALEVRWGAGQRERYPAPVADLVQRPVDVIVAAGGAAASPRAFGREKSRDEDTSRCLCESDCSPHPQRRILTI